MAIDKKLIHFKTKENFMSANGVNGNPNTPTSGSEETGNAEYGQIKGTSIVFIKDSQEIWTHGQLYSCSDPDLSNFVTKEELEELEKLSVPMISVTYNELKTLRDNGQLIPGQQYRITDYVTTTAQENTRSAGHPFDVIVTADSENTLNEEARACIHEGDTYFSDTGAKLEAWKIWYILDNDAERFAWASNEDSIFNGVGCHLRDESRDVVHNGKQYFAWYNTELGLLYYTTIESPNIGSIVFDENFDDDSYVTQFVQKGKGVIYRMIDEWNNDCPYDFKNIMFKRNLSFDNGLAEYSDDGEETWVYTFAGQSYHINNDEWSDMLDGSLESPFGHMSDENTSTFHDNTINPYIMVYNGNDVYTECGIHYLNDIVFLGYWDKIGSANDEDTPYYYAYCCHSNTFGNDCYRNTFGVNCNYNTFGNQCNYNTFGNHCYNNTFGTQCYNNTFGNHYVNNSFNHECYNNSFGNDCSSNSFGGCCVYNTFGDDCSSNSFGNECDNNTFGENCCSNSFDNRCYYNYFKSNCILNSFGNSCYYNDFGAGCVGNTFGNHCNNNRFGNTYYHNSFGNSCEYNSFKTAAGTSGVYLKNYCMHNHFDDGCSYNVILNSSTTSSSNKIQNINVNRGVRGSTSKYNYININTINSEKEINVINYNGHTYIDYGDAFKVTYSELVDLRDNSQLIAGRQYRITDYVTSTSQKDTKSAEHQFDIIVTAINEYTLSEEAQAVQNFYDGYFDDSNLSAWKIWYSLDNNTSRFAWAGDERIETTEVEVTTYDSSECTINSDLIDGNTFITPFNFESCVWVDDGDGVIPYDGDSNHDEEELIYEWGYFTDEDDNTHLCLYKSDAGLYEEEGQPDYGDKYLYRGVVNVDGTDYDYWQKWDENGGGLDVQGSGDYVFATTPRIVANPEVYSYETTTETIETVIPLEPKGVIYRMIDEWGNDCPYDFKNIMFKHPNLSDVYPDWYYTFSVDADGVSDHSLVGAHCYDNHIGECVASDKQELNVNVFVAFNKLMNTHSNIWGVNSQGNSFDGSCSRNRFGDNCTGNRFGENCKNNVFDHYFSDNCLGNNNQNNTFAAGCSSNTLERDCKYNSFGVACTSNILGYSCEGNSFGNKCSENELGGDCVNNSFGNDCCFNSFRVSEDETSSIKSYCKHNHLDDGCSYNLIWNSDTTSSSVSLKNINVNRGVSGTLTSLNMINITTLNQDYEIQVAKNSKGEIKIYCEADLIA